MDFLTNLDNYNIFYEVAKTKNLTKASENLYISQPAVSQSIKKLEENLGTTLFVRSKKGMELTLIGQKIFEKVELSLKNLSAVEELINEEKGLISGELNLGSGSNVARKILCEPVSRFLQDHPNVTINILEDVQAEMISKLSTGQLQIVISQKNEEFNLPFIPLFDTKYCFVRNKNLKCEKFITITKGSFTHKLFEKFIEDKNLQHIPTMQVSGYKTALELVFLGIGTTLVPDYLISDIINNNQIEIVHNDYHLPTITFGIYYNPTLITPATKRFLEYVTIKY